MNSTNSVWDIVSLSPHWIWLSIAALLAVLEMLAPGFFLIWLAVAALLTGLIALISPALGLAPQVLIFAALAIAAVYAGRRWFAMRPIESDDPNLNNRSARLVGEVVTVVEAISNGQGRVKVGDSVWNAKGADAAIGTQVRVAGANGAILVVEAL